MRQFDFYFIVIKSTYMKSNSCMCVGMKSSQPTFKCRVPYDSESESEVAQSCPTLCDPRDCSLPGSSIHGIFQASVLEWVAISFSRGSFQPRDRTQVSRIVGRRFTLWATRAWFFCLFCWLPMLKKAIGKILTVQMIKKHVVPQPL